MKRLITVLVLLSLSACSSMIKAGFNGANAMPTEDERRQSLQSFPDLTPQQREDFVQGRPWIGMTNAQLQSMLGGEPMSIQNRVIASGSEQVQLYNLTIGDWKSAITRKVLKARILNGKLTEIEEVPYRNGYVPSL